MKPKQHLISHAYNSLSMYLTTKLSFRDVSETMNLFLHKTSGHEINQAYRSFCRIFQLRFVSIGQIAG